MFNKYLMIVFGSLLISGSMGYCSEHDDQPNSSHSAAVSDQEVENIMDALFKSPLFDPHNKNDLSLYLAILDKTLSLTPEELEKKFSDIKKEFDEKNDESFKRIKLNISEECNNKMNNFLNQAVELLKGINKLLDLSSRDLKLFYKPISSEEGGQMEEGLCKVDPSIEPK